MRVLLTGSSGFIGTFLVSRLQSAGHVVVGLDRVPPEGPTPDNFVHGDLLEGSTLRDSLDGADWIFHLAAAKDDWGISRDEYFRDNVEATRRLIAAGDARDVRRWFHFSTVGVLGPGPDPSDETAPYAPTTDYGASKAEGERLFLDFARDHPTAEITILRPSAVYGPRHPPTTNVHRLVEAIMEGRFVMVGDGETLKTTSYLENLIEATLFLMNRSRAGANVYHYVDQPVMRTAGLVEAICQKLCIASPGLRVPLPFARSLGYVSDMIGAFLNVDIPITAARIEKFCTPTNFDASAIRRLGFRQPVPNDLAIARTVRWHRDR